MGANEKGKARIMELLIQLIAGAIGGNAAGAVLKNQSLGTLGNSIAGVIGGGLGGQILAMVGTAGAADAAAALDAGSIISALASGGVGGGVVMAVVGLLKGMMSK